MRFRQFRLRLAKLGDLYHPAGGPTFPAFLAQLETEDIPDSFAMRTAISLMLVGPNPIKTIRRETLFIDFVITGVTGGDPLFLSPPGPKGHEAANWILNTDEMQGRHCQLPAVAASRTLWKNP